MSKLFDLLFDNILMFLVSDERESGNRQRSMSSDPNRRSHAHSNTNATNAQLNQFPPQVQQYFGSSEELPGTST